MNEQTTLSSAEEKQALLAAIVSSSRDAIISKTLKGIITSWNPSAERLFGYGEEYAVGQHISLIIPPERIHEEAYIINEITHGNRIEHFETIRKRKDGGRIPISLSISPIFDKSGTVIGASKIARDISHQKEASEKKSVLAAIVGSSDDAIISKTLAGIITSWNAAAEKLFGYTEAEAIGQHISLIIPEERLEEETYIIGEISKGNKVAHFETIRRAKDGTYIPLSITVSPVINDQGIIIGASKIARDISESIAVQKEREQLYNQIEELSKRKDEFIAMATHELKTPITTLSGFLQILKMRLQPNDESFPFIEKSLKQVDKLGALINDLLDISKIQSGKLKLNYKEIEIVSVVRDVLESFEHVNTHSLILEAPHEVKISGDKIRLEQVITNLITNAIKYSPEGGNILIKIIEQDGPSICITIQDEGIGINPNHLNQLFEPFYRVADERFNISGLGLGLYITKDIIDRHHGIISVESELGKGSTFKIILPKHYDNQGVR
jgi:PAS domain S-box-containing protein